MTTRTTISITRNVGSEGHFRVELPLVPDTLNEQLLDVGMWLIRREVAHQARIIMDPPSQCVRVSFRDEHHALAFQLQFGGERNNW